MMWRSLAIVICALLFVAAARVLIRAGYSHWWIFGLCVPLLNLYLLVRSALKILQKSGYPSAWVVIFFIPIAGFVLLGAMAFTKWPQRTEFDAR